MCKQLNLFQTELNHWKKSTELLPTRDNDFDTLSGEKLDICYFPKTPNDNYLNNIGFPGVFPYTRGVHPNLYRGKLWTMRQFAGFGKPEDTNHRFKKLLEKGQTGLSVAYDMPTLMGYDPDHPYSQGEVGKCGVSVSSLADMETLFDGIDLGQISVSQTINGPAIILLAFYIAVAEKQRVPLNQLRGTLQNDILKEFIAQKEWIFPPKPSMRIITDMMAYCTDHMPKFNTISISGYHIREAGSTAAQELAFTLANGFAYVEHGIEAGLNVDDFAPRLSFFFNSHLDFFEEISKFRAARRIWAKRMKNVYGAKNEKSWKLRFHTQTAGCSLTAQQPEINIARTGFQALAGVLGGTQSLHTNSMDETLALPTEKAAEIALRTQQLIAYETGVTNVVDPLGGSWYVEKMTDEIEKKSEKYFNEIESLGGVIPAIEQGFFQREIAHAASDYQSKLDSNQRIMVGVNRFVKVDEEIDIPILEIGAEAGDGQRQKMAEIKENRNESLVQESLLQIKDACKSGENLMPPIIKAAKAYVTMGEIVKALKTEFGEWQESAIF
ncbi:MAG: methylmalonyl-CoA mutase family protein [Candidatus Marinimicrobia bacterium]|jgi:methylmalonyl-CoA mutase N-terminal domain/subunit|nr:methylmalonyl-CoA mutase family protein [Candidatus Neomarinimicrobiota bacterium]MBT3501836.1 methylmalonyl-CoA mutase family protein [Candidatus Neomarinimicrobiota bacterium]MBT3838638.1 methylmalonyl-CoA mutase family protein [Candidatus Neomarinimicrobiota bacterium]MBT3999748.1 methylmalonyl-CoA mutase family protein [Candidatus Neomarinimicrobiota bacterium]MBT4578617.1 methylmalonyl-CoA mutase family protein [Candidatus Neomarinimicrobiota bacterium]